MTTCCIKKEILGYVMEKEKKSLPCSKMPTNTCSGDDEDRKSSFDKYMVVAVSDKNY